MRVALELQLETRVNNLPQDYIMHYHARSWFGTGVMELMWVDPSYICIEIDILFRDIDNDSSSNPGIFKSSVQDPYQGRGLEFWKCKK